MIGKNILASMLFQIGVLVGQPFNGTDFMRDPVFGWFKPFMDFFGKATGQAGTFFVVLIVIFAIGIYIKTQDLIFTVMFIIVSSGILSAGSFMAGVPSLSMIFTVICAIGVTALVIELIFHIKR